jgi:hypothetical protein
VAELRAAFETRYGRLGMGASQVCVGGVTLELNEVMHRLALDFDGNRVIDSPDVGPGRHAVRYFDGEDRRIVCYEFGADLGFIEEHRVHIAEWLGDAYWQTTWEVNCPIEL